MLLTSIIPSGIYRVSVRMARKAHKNIFSQKGIIMEVTAKCNHCGFTVKFKLELNEHGFFVLPNTAYCAKCLPGFWPLIYEVGITEKPKLTQADFDRREDVIMWRAKAQLARSELAPRPRIELR